MTADALRGRDRLAGALLVVLGAGVLWESAGYGMGTPDRMGPGLFPGLIGAALALLGVLIPVFGGVDHDGPEAMPSPDWRGWCCIIGGVGLFIVLGEAFGLAPGAFACVFVSALGDRKASLREALALAAGCTLIAALGFSVLLHFQLPLFRWGWA